MDLDHLTTGDEEALKPNTSVNPARLLADSEVAVRLNQLDRDSLCLSHFVCSMTMDLDHLAAGDEDHTEDL